MKIRTITFGLNPTVNVGNYQSIKPNLSITAEVADGEDMEKAYNTLKQLVEDTIEAELNSYDVSLRDLGKVD